MVIELILAALALTAAGSAVAAIRRKRRQEPKLPPLLMAPRQLDKGELKPNDVVSHLGSDYLVEGVATLREGERAVLVVAWMTDGGVARTLIVDLVDQPRCVLAERRDERAAGLAIPSWIEDDGLELRLTRRAAVRVTSTGESELPADGACEFGIFQGPGNRKGVMLIADKLVSLFIGKGVTEAGLTLLPGGDQ